MSETPAGPEGSSWWAFALGPLLGADTHPAARVEFWSAASRVLPLEAAPPVLRPRCLKEVADQAHHHACSGPSREQEVLCAAVRRLAQVWGSPGSFGVLTHVLDRQTRETNPAALDVISVLLETGSSWDEKVGASGLLGFTCLQHVLLHQKQLPASPFAASSPRQGLAPDGRTLLHCLFDGYRPTDPQEPAREWVFMLSTLRALMSLGDHEGVDWSKRDRCGRTPLEAWEEANARHPEQPWVPLEARVRRFAGVARHPQTGRLSTAWGEETLAWARSGHLSAGLPAPTPRAKVRL